MAKLFLDNTLLAEEFFSDALLMGVQCSLEPHQLIWLINKKFLYNFRYQNQAEIIMQKRQRNFIFPVFQCHEPHLHITHFIYANKHSGEYLLPELKHFDYIWLMKGEWASGDLPGLIMKELKTLPEIQIVAMVTADKIRNKTQMVM